MNVPWWLGPLNLLVLQWFFVRLAVVIYSDTGERIQWLWIRWVVPGTGWFTNFRFIGEPRG